MKPFMRFRRCVPLLLSLLSSVVIPLVSTTSSVRAQTPPPVLIETQATVWRDEWGVPHIEAPDEPTAWYALGYEEAKDALLHIQITVKRIRGEAVKFLGNDDSRGLRNDMMVQILGTYLSNKTEPELRALLAPSPGNGMTGNLWDNCKAMAQGINAYRMEVATSNVANSPEMKLRLWLDQKQLSWVYQDEVRAVDFASWGRWSNSFLQALLAGLKGSVGPNSFGSAFALSPSIVADDAQELIESPMTDGSSPLLAALKWELRGFPGAGSNAIAWSFNHTLDANGVRWSGCMADPHGGGQHEPLGLEVGVGSPDRHYDPTSGRDLVAMQNWFAHIKVTPPGQTTPTLDAYGEMSHGMPTFFTCHNQDVAYGGSLSTPNISDGFVLRLRPDVAMPDGVARPLQYYSYYHDTDLTDGTKDADWRPLVEHTVTIQRFRGATSGPTQVTLPYWRADSFGFAFPDLGAAAAHVGDPSMHARPTQPVFVHGEKDATWRLKPGQGQMRYWGQPQFQNGVPTTEPMMSVLRLPIDLHVSGEDHHSRITVALWECAHARTIWDVAANFVDHDANYLVEFTVVDRAGRIFASQLGTVPRRGDDAKLKDIDYRPFPEKFAAYAGAGGGVPARYAKDRIFDWQFTNYSNPDKPTGLEYLAPLGIGGHGAVNFMPYIVWDPTTGILFPPASIPIIGPFKIENGGFAAMCNDMAWHGSVKRESLQEISNPQNFNDVLVTGNGLLQAILDAGTLYQTSSISLEAQDRNQLIIDRLTAQAEYWLSGGTSGTPPMSPTQAKKFALETRLYVASDCPSPDQPLGSPASPNAAYPRTVRMLKDVVDTMSSTDPIISEAAREAKFMNDLWSTLWNGPASNFTFISSSGSLDTFNLMNVWIKNSDSRGVFWFDFSIDPTNPELKWLPMPPGFPLIDFMWNESEIGDNAKVVDNALGGMSAADRAQLASHVQTLVDWESPTVPIADRYRMHPGSSGAALYTLYDRSFDALAEFGRHWVRLDDGRAIFVKSNTIEKVALTNGTLPAPPPSFTLLRESVPWAGLRGLPFPISQVDSLIGTNPAFTSSAGLPTPPYDALYSSGGTGPVKTTFTPSDINKIVEFFLSLGGYYVNPAANNGNPSRKIARFSLIGNPGVFNIVRPPNYPLTRGLARVAVLRRLLDSGNFWTNLAPTGNTLGDILRTRLFSHDGVAYWPPNANGNGVDLTGAPAHGGSLRSVSLTPDKSPGAGMVPGRGLQPRFFTMGGSFVPLMTLFPWMLPQTPPESYFWCAPANRHLRPDDPTFTSLMPKYANNELAPTRYTDYRTASGTTSYSVTYSR